jgi:dCMP deaminase
MRIATVISERGTCTRLQVGAVIAREGRIISTGYVGSPPGANHCTPELDRLDSLLGCQRTTHAEANAIAFAARAGTSTENAEIFITHSPCLACAKLVAAAGISRVVYEQPYRITDGIDLLDQLGITVEQM